MIKKKNQKKTPQLVKVLLLIKKNLVSLQIPETIHHQVSEDLLREKEFSERALGNNHTHRALLHSCRCVPGMTSLVLGQPIPSGWHWLLAVSPSSATSFRS